MTLLASFATIAHSSPSILWAQDQPATTLPVTFDIWATWANLALPALVGLLTYLAVDRRHLQTVRRETVKELTSGPTAKVRQNFVRLLYDPSYCPAPQEVDDLYSDMCWVFQRGFHISKSKYFRYGSEYTELHFHVNYIANCILDFHQAVNHSKSDSQLTLANNSWLWQQIGDDASYASPGYHYKVNPVLVNKLKTHYSQLPIPAPTSITPPVSSPQNKLIANPKQRTPSKQKLKNWLRRD